MRVDFDFSVRLESNGARVPSDGSRLAYRELAEKLGLTAAAAACLIDSRRGLNKRDSLIGLLRQSIYAYLASFEDVNDGNPNIA